METIILLGMSKLRRDVHNNLSNFISLSEAEETQWNLQNKQQETITPTIY